MITETLRAKRITLRELKGLLMEVEGSYLPDAILLIEMIELIEHTAAGDPSAQLLARHLQSLRERGALDALFDVAMRTTKGKQLINKVLEKRTVQ